MPELENFITDIKKEYRQDLKNLEEFQTLLKTLGTEEKVFYRSYQIVSNS